MQPGNISLACGLHNGMEHFFELEYEFERARIINAFIVLFWTAIGIAYTLRELYQRKFT